MTIIHTFLYDPDFINTSSIIDPVLKTGGMCFLSPKSLSYFVNPQEFADERTSRGTSLNALLVKVPKLIFDQSQFSQFNTDISTVWSSTEKNNLFSIIDYLLFSYNANATTEQIELALSTWSQYVPNTYVLSNTKTQATAYLSTPETITIPDYITFSFMIAGGTQYEIRVWANNTVFLAEYPISTIAVVVPPLPLTQLYSLDLVSGIANIFQTALASSTLSQQTLQSYLQSGEYSGFLAQDITFVDANNNTTVVQFNVLYNGAVPGTIAIRAALSNLLLNSGVGTTAGWKARAPSIFVTELWYLIPLWENTTNQVANIVYPNIVATETLTTDATKVLYDMEASFVTSNLDVITSFYNNITMAAVPDVENSSSRLSLAAEHPTYQDVPSTNPAFNYMAAATQLFANLLGAALSVAAGNVSTNNALITYTPIGDNRTYITFSVLDVEYYVITKNSYMPLVTA